ncbi:MAG: TonB-dependent receptor plug domain-containing protein, partial [Bacteroidales bacterium]
EKELKEVIVDAAYIRRMISQERIAQTRFTPELMNFIPSPGSENDVLKALQLLPGVNQGSDGKSELFVRGGNGDENLFLVDGISLYNPNHLFGFFSAFDGNILESVDFYKGAFPARYGSRLSSVVDMQVKEGDFSKLKGKVAVGLISTTAYLEGPIWKNRTSFLVSARRTYLDLIAVPIYKAINSSDSGNEKSSSSYDYNFTDINAKITHRVADGHKLTFLAYWGNDHFSQSETLKGVFSSDGETIKSSESSLDKRRWGNTLTGLTYEFRPNSTFSGKANIAYTEFRSHRNRKTSVEENNGQLQKSRKTIIGEQTGIRDLSAKADFSWITSKKNRIEFGMEAIRHLYTPEMSKTVISEKNEENKTDRNSSADRIKATEFAVYAEDIFGITEKTELIAGVRFVGFHTENKNYLTLQPRVALSCHATPELTLRAAYSEMSQYIHMLSDEGLLMSAELWVPVTENLRPMYSRQITGGATYRFLTGWDVSAEGYYKTLDNVTDYKDGVIKRTALWKEGLTQGKGNAYGMELMLRKNAGKTQGWIGYTLGWSNRWFPNGEVNNGHRFPAKFDTRHNVNIVMNHRFSKRFDISAAWSYHSGSNTTVALESYQSSDVLPGNLRPGLSVNGGEVFFPEYRNNFRMPAYHRLDLGCNFYRQGKRGLSTWSIDVYNAYCRLNTTAVNIYRKYEKPDEGGTQQMNPFISYKWMLPVIPTFTYSFTF